MITESQEEKCLMNAIGKLKEIKGQNQGYFFKSTLEVDNKTTTMQQGIRGIQLSLNISFII